MHLVWKGDWHRWEYTVVWVDHITFESGPLGQHLKRQMGFLLLVSLQFKPLCVCVCVPSSLSVQILRLSSWTISQIRDMCLMFSWKRAEGTCWAPYDIYFLRQGWKNRERVTARWSKTGDKFLSRLIMYCFVFVFCQSVCLFLTH